MENKNTQPQAFYTKTPSAGASANLNSSVDEKHEPKKKNNLRNIFAISGLLFFVIVALTGVFIAQRQVTKEGEEIKTVAPTAPESKPQAAVDEINNCSTGFFVPKPGDAVCDDKVALNDFTKNGGEYISPVRIFNSGDYFVFRITASATNDTSEDVIVVDELSDSLIFINDSDNTPNIVNNGQTVSINLGQMTAGEIKNIEFKVQVVSGLGVLDGETQANIATITTGNNEETKSSCSYEFHTVEGKVECISKVLYDGDPSDAGSEIVPAGSALTRNEEYVYYITVNPTNKTNGEVKLYDIIPDSLEFVRALPESAQYISNTAGDNTIFVNFGILENREYGDLDVVTLGFVVKVVDDPTIGDFDNSALVYIYPPESELTEPLAEGSICRVSHGVLPIGTAQCVEKEAFTDFDGSEITDNQIVDPGQEFIYRISVKADDLTTGDVIIVDQLSEDLTFVDDPENTTGLEYDSDTREITMNHGIIDANETKIAEFKVQVIADPSGNTINNIATVTTNDKTSHTCEIPLLTQEETYSCNEACETNSDCQEASDDYICYSTDDGNLCRLESAPDEEDCRPGSTPTPTPTPTPAPGCNELCETNADCSNSSHVCMTTADESNRCRLETIPNSETCVVPSTTQPDLPETLPETGPEDWLNWLKAGLVTLGVGTALFLML